MMHILNVDIRAVLSEDEAVSDIVPTPGYIKVRNFGLAMDPAHIRPFPERLLPL